MDPVSPEPFDSPPHNDDRQDRGRGRSNAESSLTQILLDRMPGIALLLKPGTRKIAVTNQAGRDVGAAPDLTCYQTWGQRTDPCPWCLAPRLWETGEPQHIEIEAKGIVWDAYWIPISNDLYLHYAFDITARRKAEEEQRESQENLRHTQKLESLGIMAGGIAHDFNNLFLAILGNTDLALLDLPPDSPARTSIEAIQGATKQAADLSTQMLIYSRRSAPELEGVPLADLIREMQPLLKISVSRQVAFNCNIEPDLPQVLADASQLRQVILNLVINASEAIGSSDGSIDIEVGVRKITREDLASTYVDDGLPPGSYLCLKVTDTGSGMDDDTKARLFDPFYTTKAIGRGLGLSTVLGIVRGHRGAIRILSAPSRGSTFTVLLPAFAENRIASPETCLERDEAWIGHGTVLLVDDEDFVREVTTRMLERLGLRVRVAADGTEAIRELKEQGDQIHCIILDLTMPHMRAEDLLESVHQLRSDLPVILSSGFGREEVESRSLAGKVAGFLQKPYQIEELRTVLKEAMEGAPVRVRRAG